MTLNASMRIVCDQECNVQPSEQLFGTTGYARVTSTMRSQKVCPRHLYRVSGEPMLNKSCHFLGYRGIGVEINVSKLG